jgi:hypothetical protein
VPGAMASHRLAEDEGPQSNTVGDEGHDSTALRRSAEDEVKPETKTRMEIHTHFGSYGKCSIFTSQIQK